MSASTACRAAARSSLSITSTYCFWHNPANREKWYKEVPKGEGYQLWNTTTNGQWTTHTFKMMHSFPENMKLWDEYWGVRITPDKSPGGSKVRALAFYKKHRKEMDAGASMYWNDRYREDEKETSGIRLTRYKTVTKGSTGTSSK